jgi:hypothetical protein
VRNLSAPDVWIAKDDGSELLRATSIAGVGRDYAGNITARLGGGDQTVVTLVAGSSFDEDADGDSADPRRTPADFHRQLVMMISGLADTAEHAIVRPVHDSERGWRWLTERP